MRPKELHKLVNGVCPFCSSKAKPFETFGYALAMRVMQSELYQQLDDKERAECDGLIEYGAWKSAAQRLRGKK